jgi:signal peptidase I
MLIVLLTLTGFRSTVADWNDVPTGSMEPTILPGDRIAVNKLAYDLKIPFTNRPLFPAWGDPSRGDVVVFFEPESGMRMVKRVVAIPGDRIEVRARRLIINGNPVQYNRDGDPGKFEQTEQIIENLPGKQHRIQLRPFQPSYADFGPITLPEDQYFVMGDNRDNSRDSRAFGQIPRHAIVGRAFGVALSFGERGVLSPRWGRFFSPIH